MERCNPLTPENKRYVDRDLYDFLKSLMRPINTNHNSSHADLIHNEIVREQLRRFESCVGKRK